MSKQSWQGVYRKPKSCEITMSGADLPAMEEEARRQFADAFVGKTWMVTEINAKLDMVLVGDDHRQWLPGMWNVTYTAKELA